LCNVLSQLWTVIFKNMPKYQHMYLRNKVKASVVFGA
jgi:hypothetical protein